MMERRGFLGLLGAAVIAPFVPTPAPIFTGLDLATGPDYTVVWTAGPLLPLRPHDLEYVDAVPFTPEQIARLFKVDVEDLR